MPNNWVRHLLIAEFAYNNATNASTSYILFKYNCGYHLKVFFKEDVDPYLRSRCTNKLVQWLRELIKVYCQNLLYAQELKKRAYDKRVKSCSHTQDEIVWLNSKYIKTKRNKKLENMFFKPFKVFHAVEKQAHKLELSIK